MSIVLEITVQETVGGVLHSVAGAEVTVREETAVSQAVVIETGVSSASLSDLLLIRDDTEAARADAEASEAAALAHKNAAATSEANALNHKNAADSSKTAAAASATAAATSEANALSHKNAANSSKTAAAASETAAGNSAAAANNSKVAAAASETAAGNSAAAANNSKVAAATSEANALSHKNAADSSKAAAAASATAAAASEANALSHKNAADSSKTAAAASATAAAASEANALSHKNAADSSKAAAAASATAAATSEANALSHKNAADSSKTAAAASATAAATSEANALSHKNAADSSKTAAAVSEANALSHKNAAGVSATAASDSQASAALSAANAAASETAAAASAAQAQQYAVAVSSALIFRGGWSAAGGTYPTPSMNPETSDYYRITVGGTMTGTQGSITVTAGDYLHWDMTLDQWFKIDAVDAVTSVAGRTGDVTLTKTDVGLANVPNTDATNASNITSGTLAAARLPASINAATTGNAATATKLATARTINGVAFDGTANITIADDTKLPSGANAVSATKLATARTINGVAFDGTANITIADDTKLPLTGGVLTGGLCIGDGTAAANTTVVGDLEHYLELRGTTATYPSALGVAFHHEGISTSALVHGQVNADMGYFNLRTDDPNLKVYFKDQEVWDSATGLRASKSAAGTLGNNADWDAFTLHGVYLVQMSTFSGSNNAPPAVYPFGIMHADVADFGGEQRMMQIYYPHNIDTDRCIYQRMRNAGVWTGWTKIWRGGTGDGSGLVSEAVIKTVTGTNVANLVYGNMADNDQFRIRIGGTASNSGYAEIATADDGTEPIYVRQYTGVFSSLLRTLTLLDSNGNTIIPGITYGSSFYGSSFNVSGNSDGLHTGNGDSATSTDNNVKIASWFGIGFSPSITGQPVPYGQYSHWFNVRDGSAGMRGALSQNSDIRLKENIEVIQDALAKTCTLRGIVYDRKDGGGRSTGVVAQEVQAVLPEAVTAQEDEMQTLSVAYGNMVGLLIEAIKELKGEVDNLKAEVALLKSA